MEKEILQELAVDLDKLSQLRPPVPSADISQNPAIVSAGSSYTRIWKHSTWISHADPPHKRYFKHIWRWSSSSTARKIMPAVLLAATWSIVLSLLSSKYKQSWSRLLAATGSSQTFGFLSAPLVLLLTLRANASMGRLLEARALFGQVVLHARSLANIIKVYSFPTSPAASALAIRHLVLMGWILKASLRGESKESEDQVVGTMLTGRDYAWLTQQPKRTVAATSRIRQICAHITTSRTGIQDHSTSAGIQLVMEEKIMALEAITGGCERLFASPIPPTYSRHLSRVLCMWLFLMPISLIGAGLSFTGVVAATILSSYVLIGIDEVGMEIEEAFSMLPLQELSGAVQNDVRAQFLEDQGEMPPLSA